MLTAINGEIDDSTIIAGTLTPYLLQWTDHPDGKSINKNLEWHVRPDGLNWYL